MFFAITKINFEVDDATDHDIRELRNLCDKVRSKFKVAVRPILHSNHTTTSYAIMVASLHPKENELNQQIDQIMSFCELCGYGRIESESTILEDFDAFEHD